MRESQSRPRRDSAPRLLAALVVAATVAAGTAAAGAPAVTAEQAEFFEAKVRPVLVESCGKCHGPKKQASGLRLDSRDAILEGGLNGPAVVPGDPDASLLVQAVRQTHEDVKMPPKGKLPGAQVEALAAWVKQGAPWPKDAPGDGTKDDPASTHWAFRPVRRVDPPAVKGAGWVRTPVDAFVLSRLEAAGLEPSPAADRRTLVRRATFDLTGLPPTPDEVEAFVADGRPDAYERLLDRLLASPAYGERWGRHWLDAARYADTKGYVFNQDRRYPYSYTYRDYVIRAFNEDKPYDLFLTEQIAADRLPPGGDPGALAALGFLTVGRRYLNNNEDIIDDRIDVVTRGLLGLTVSCARCHDHKFDPIPTDDYYSLFGVFSASFEPAELPEIPSAAPAPLREEFRARLAEAQKKVDDFKAAKAAEVGADARDRLGVYLRAAFDLEFASARRDPKLDERARADAIPPGRLRGFSARWKARLDATRGTHDPVFAPWHAFAALPAGEGFAAKAAEAAKALPVDGPKACNPVLARSFAAKPPATMAEVAARYAEVLADVDRAWKEAAKSGAGALYDPAREAIRQVLYADSGPVCVPPEGLNRLLDTAEQIKLTELNNGVAALKTTHPGSPPRAMVLNDVTDPPQPRVFLRGNPGRPGKEVPRRFLKVLSGADRAPFGKGSGRLELARAVADKGNPLTARVMVNRVWLDHFGAGLVATPSDFGVRSEPPTHPELLDWLADDFVRSGWSVKGLHRRIMLSSAYRQRGDHRPVAALKDPLNRLLWKFNRRRLDFEATRDALLAVSGGIDRSMGGRSLAINAPPFPPRRTVYGTIDRLDLDGVYRTFDFASPDASSPRRLVTTVPQQALFLMNSPFVIEQSRRLAVAGGPTPVEPGERVDRLYRRLYGRGPDPRERALGVEFVRRQEGAGPSLPQVWAYGWGRVDAGSAAGPLTDVRPFPHWTGKTWQLGPAMPDPVGRHAQWHAHGGHPGGDPAHAVVLRWAAPRDAFVTVEGSLSHPADQGDGVRGRVVSSRDGVVGDWVAFHQSTATPVARREVKAGETLDFVVDCRHDDGFDGFTWAPVVREAGGAAETWDAAAGFHGPAAEGLSPWEEYAQVLLMANEFVFVD